MCVRNSGKFFYFHSKLKLLSNWEAYSVKLSELHIRVSAQYIWNGKASGSPMREELTDLWALTCLTACLPVRPCAPLTLAPVALERGASLTGSTAPSRMAIFFSLANTHCVNLSSKLRWKCIFKADEGGIHGHDQVQVLWWRRNNRARNVHCQRLPPLI